MLHFVQHVTIMQAALLPASPLADYVTGATLVVDGEASTGPVGLRVIDR